MTISELIEILQDYQKDCGCSITKDYDRLIFWVDGKMYKVDYVEPYVQFGCGCTIGAEVNLKEATD